MKRAVVFLIVLVNVLYLSAQDIEKKMSDLKTGFLNAQYDKVLQDSRAIIEGSKADSTQMSLVFSYAGLSSEKLGKNEEAIKYYKSAILNKVPRLDIYDQLIYLSSSIGNHQSYEWALKEKLKAFPDFKFEITETLAQHYLKTKQYGSLLEEAHTLTIFNPEDTRYLYYQAIAYKNLDKEEDEAISYNKILKLDSTHVGANIGMGVLLYTKGSTMFKKEKAKYESIKAPTRIDYTNYTKSLDKAKQVYREALPYLLSAYNNGGNKSSLKGVISNIYTRIGDKESAEKYK